MHYHHNYNIYSSPLLISQIALVSQPGKTLKESRLKNKQEEKLIEAMKPFDQMQEVHFPLCSIPVHLCVVVNHSPDPHFFHFSSHPLAGQCCYIGGNGLLLS